MFYRARYQWVHDVGFAQLFDTWQDAYNVQNYVLPYVGPGYHLEPERAAEVEIRGVKLSLMETAG